ncbi:MAG: hypothetical protein K2L99_01750 [Muribaculaceae bacterium]|nr:hypothetical protein [Muribaculaceae bacterium]
MKPPLRILSLIIAVALPCIAMAGPRHEASKRPAEELRPTLSLKKFAPRAEQSLNILGAELRELVKHPLNARCEVGLSSVKSWRPLEHYGDNDNKLRVYNPRLGVALSYRF